MTSCTFGATSSAISSTDSLAIESAIAEIETEAKEERTLTQEVKKEKNRQLVRKILLNVGKAVGIVLILLIGRWIIILIGRKVGDEKTYDNVVEGDSVAVLFVGASSQETAAGIARSLVEERLAACANILNGTSLRSPAGEAVPDTLMVIKTARRRLKTVVRRIRDLHMNPTPEIIPYPIDYGLKPYLTWVLESTDSKPWWHRFKRSQ
jgi:periplasmic divalent cation tolerance protein